MAARKPRPKPANPTRPPTPKKDWAAAFLLALAGGGCVAYAAKKAGVHRSVAYDRRAADPDFALAWDQARAEAVEYMEQEAHRRAVQGVKKPVFYLGEVVGHVNEYSDTLLIFLMKAADPKKYRDNVRLEHAGDGGGPVQVEAVGSVFDRIEARLAELTGGPVDAGATRNPPGDGP